MPFATVKIQPGVKTEQTPTLLTANIVASQNIRWRGGLPEKIGGWIEFFGSNITWLVRAIWPWADNNSTSHVAVAGDGGVNVITAGVLTDITPGSLDGLGITFTTTMGQSLVAVSDTSAIPDLSEYSVVVFETHIQIAGIIIYGAYDVLTVTSTAGPSTYSIETNQVAGSSTSTNTVTQYDTTNGSTVITVTLASHGQVVGSDWPIPIPFTIGGITLSGFYNVTSVISSSQFTISAPQPATATATQSPGVVYYYVGAGGTSYGTPTYTDWSLGNFGNNLVINPKNGPIFGWNPISGMTTARMNSEAPASATGFFIAMPQEQIVAFGAAVELIQDPMLVAWSDAGTAVVWTAAANNQAGSYRLTRGSAIIGGMQGPQQAVLWTDVGFWLMQYVGYPDVYGFFEIAQGCGLIALHAAATVGNVIYWMGQSGFWAYTGSAVTPLPCEVWDTIFPTNITTTAAFVENIRACGNTGYNEVTWYYPSDSSVSGENDSYVRYNIATGEWDFGQLAVSAWADYNIYGHPFGVMPDPNDATQSQIMHMERTNNANGLPISWSYTTGFFMLSEGEDKVFVDLIIPDFKWHRYEQSSSVSETINFTLYSQDYPEDPSQPAVAYGPYAVTNATGAIEVRVRGRYFSATISGNDLNRWSRLGGIKFRFAPDGRN